MRLETRCIIRARARDHYFDTGWRDIKLWVEEGGGLLRKREREPNEIESNSASSKVSRRVGVYTPVCKSFGSSYRILAFAFKTDFFLFFGSLDTTPATLFHLIRRRKVL